VAASHPGRAHRKQKARITRAEAAQGAKPVARGRDVELKMDATRSGRTVLELDHLVLSRAGRVLIDDLTLSVAPGSRIGIVGPNGCGKSSLLAALLGDLLTTSGTLLLGQNAQIAYLDQHRSGLDLEKTVAENVSPSATRVEWGGRTIELISYLERMLFDAHQQRQPVRSLSGGERARVLLAKLLLQPANLLVLDEPTNDLDAPTPRRARGAARGVHGDRARGHP
jgi:ATP-binding cassette subfamily F protein uup